MVMQTKINDYIFKLILNFLMILLSNSYHVAVVQGNPQKVDFVEQARKFKYV